MQINMVNLLLGATHVHVFCFLTATRCENLCDALQRGGAGSWNQQRVHKTYSNAFTPQYQGMHALFGIYAATSFLG